MLSRPQIRTLDNQSAFIQVGQRVPRITASNLTAGGLQTNTVELENVGIILGVTPRISPDNTVVMEIDAEKSALGPEEKGVPITVSLDGTVIRSPSVEIQTAQATVSAASGETIVLGGMITTRDETITRRVPYLADVPVLGNLFRFDSATEIRAELLIILTPHVIRSPEDAQRLKEIEMSRMSWCAADIYEIHGDVGAAYEPGVVNDRDTEVIYPDLNPRGIPATPPEPDAELEPALPNGEMSVPENSLPLLEPPSGPDSSRVQVTRTEHRLVSTDPEQPLDPSSDKTKSGAERTRRRWPPRLSELIPRKSRKQESTK